MPGGHQKTMLRVWVSHTERAPESDARECRLHQEGTGKRCSECGSHQEGTGKRCPECGSHQAGTGKRCPECGSHQEGTGKRCPECGSHQEGTAEEGNHVFYSHCSFARSWKMLVLSPPGYSSFCWSLLFDYHYYYCLLLYSVVLCSQAGSLHSYRMRFWINACILKNKNKIARCLISTKVVC